jgi:uncharacterized protein YjbI with pentapeptide repeats
MISRSLRSFGVAFLSLITPTMCLAAIYQWTTDINGNIIESGTLCPGGDGVSAVSGADISKRNLTQAYMPNVDLTYADLTSTILYYADLTNATLSGANLNGTKFMDANLSGAILDGCNIVNHASFSGTNLTSNQLYSTASYKEHNLFGIDLSGNNLAGWNFDEQNLTFAQLQWSNVTGTIFSNANLNSAHFSGTNLTNAILNKADLSNATFPYANLTNASLINANLTCAEFSSSILTSANLTGADLRNAHGFDPMGATIINAIMPDGTIQGLHLDQANSSLIVRNSFYPLMMPIHLSQEVQLESGSIMEFILTDESWHSTISFDKDIPVTLVGDLQLEIDSTNPVYLIGASFQLFDWTGVNPTGQFQILSDYVWDTSHLYTDGTVTLLNVPEPSTIMLMGCVAVLWALITIAWPCFSRVGKILSSACSLQD